MTTPTIKKRAEGVAYETKVLLIAIGSLIKKSNSMEELYKEIAKMANAEGVILEPFNEE